MALEANVGPDGGSTKYRKYKVSTETKVFSEPRFDAPVKGKIEAGTDDIEGRKYQGAWLFNGEGWIPLGALENVVEPPEVETTDENSEEEEEEKKEYIFAEDEDEGGGYQYDVFGDLNKNLRASVDDSVFKKMDSVTGVFGLPYQFLPLTDPRLDAEKGQNITTDYTGVGYEYAEKIVSQMPLLLISPGRPNFMTKFSKKQKQTLLEQWISNGADPSTLSLGDLDIDNGRYYTFEYDNTGYYSYVNPMCRIASIYLGIENYKIGGTALKNINWEEFTTTKVKNIIDFGEFKSVPFYLESETSISESFSNSTTQSMISSAVNSISDMGRELNFLLGYGAAGTGIDNVLNDADIQQNVQNVQDMVKGLLGSGGNFISNLANHLTTVAAGGKLMFPEIWADSQFSRSYSCELKFISPDPSPLSIYLNILVPLFHLIGLVAPQCIDGNPNGYANPFIIRAVYKGFFNIDMGIITDMSITKGAEGQWTPDGLPMSLNVSMSLKDLYNAMALTPTTLTNFAFDTVSNTALMDYIANLCGINIFKPDAGKSMIIKLINSGENRLKDIPKNIWSSITTKVQNLIVNGIFT